jgi:hypothetical protein
VNRSQADVNDATGSELTICSVVLAVAVAPRLSVTVNCTTNVPLT